MTITKVTEVKVNDTVSYPRYFARNTVERIEYRMNDNGTDFVVLWFDNGRLGIHALDESVIVL